MSLSGQAGPESGAVSVDEMLADEMDAMESADMAPCAVCWDKGSGFHYGVYTCEGCKGFFKRTVQKNMSYLCKEKGACQINKMTRNNCQACRYQRCLAIGMKKEAVREDHTPGGKPRVKKVKLDYSNTQSSGTVDWRDSSSELSETDLLMIQQLMDAAPNIIPDADESAAEFDVSGLMNFGYVELRLIIDWSRQVPGFRGLLLEDQMALLKSAFMELSILRLAYRSLDCGRALRFNQCLAVNPSHCSHIGWNSELVDSLLEFCERLRDVAIDLTEFCVLNAVLLTYPDAAGLVDRQAVMELQTEFVTLLEKYTMYRYPENVSRCGRILLRLSSLRAISAKAADKFLSLSLEGDVKMNALVLEMMN